MALYNPAVGINWQWVHFMPHVDFILENASLYSNILQHKKIVIDVVYQSE